MAISKVLIANRGEIAVRIMRACDAMGIETVLAMSDADRDSLPARMAGQTLCIGPASAAHSYLNFAAVTQAALGTGCDALHPGYGFLAESPDLAEACEKNGITFVGPKAEHMRQMGTKIQARILAEECGVPTLPGSARIASPEEAVEVAERIGMPVMLKAASGGGGRGMKIVDDLAELPNVFAAASAEAGAAFGDNTLYMERFIANARHIEVQVLGDGAGNVIHLGERDCSLQRRHQKIVEEAPAPNVAEEFRTEIHAAAIKLARNIGYVNAGTVEFIMDQDAGTFYFLEMNTRIQVEHPVSEMITGFDLVAEQFRIAGGEELRHSQSDVTFTGHAIECRLNAELPEENFRPTPGLITEWQAPEGPHIRLDTHCYEGYSVPMFYDSMIGKLIVHGADRAQALAQISQALEEFNISGIGNTLEFLKVVMSDKDFSAGRVNTNLVEKLIHKL